MLNRSIAGLTASLLSLTVLTACGASAPVLRSQRTGDLAPCPSAPHCVNSQAKDPDHNIAALSYTGSPVMAREKLARVLERMQSLGYNVVSSEGDYLHATYTTGIMKYVDDLEFVFSQSEHGVIHVRSSSRIGYADFGANRKHVEEVRNAYTIAKS